MGLNQNWDWVSPKYPNWDLLLQYNYPFSSEAAVHFQFRPLAQYFGGLSIIRYVLFYYSSSRGETEIGATIIHPDGDWQEYSQIWEKLIG